MTLISITILLTQERRGQMTPLCYRLNRGELGVNAFQMLMVDGVIGENPVHRRYVGVMNTLKTVLKKIYIYTGACSTACPEYPHGRGMLDVNRDM